MQIQSVSSINSLKMKENKLNKNVQNPIISQEPREIFAYQDFNISFRARTPENFYEQEFNKKNMPETMKMYLEFDYENRKHMPPEQMMQEVFGYLEFAKDFDDVRKMYPTEPLFEELHPNTKKNRNNLLAEIEMVKDLTSEPLLKNGSNDLGMYILKKIFIEGKTVKEINKDFYEKDVNNSYKDLLKKELDYSVTESYGIKYPKQAFWNSFIATRDEYKKFFITLPKKDPIFRPENVKSRIDYNRIKSVTEVKKQPKKIVRKYTTPNHKKIQLTNEIKNTRGSLESIEKKIRKRFTKSDIEAPFVLKYMSPIMTIAADRVHLSEEMKNFAEKTNLEQTSDEAFFARFWKANPLVLEDYAKTIPDTIELFEETYEDGGLIPINKDFEVIKDETLDKKVIDYVPTRFVELLDYAKNIDKERQEKYALHNKIQNELNDVFVQLKVENSPSKQQAHIENFKSSEDEINEMLRKSAKENNAEFYEFKDVEGNKLVFTGSLDEAFKDCIIDLLGTARYYPKSFQKKYQKFFLSQPEVDTKYKLSVVATRYNLDTEDLYTPAELAEITDKIKFPEDFFLLPVISTFVIADFLCLKYQDKIPVNIKNATASIDFYNLLEETQLEDGSKLSDIVIKSNKEIEDMLSYYQSHPLSNKETLTIRKGLTKRFKESIKIKNNEDINIFCDIIKNNIQEDSVAKQKFKQLLATWLKTCDITLSRYVARSLLVTELNNYNKKVFLLEKFFDETIFSKNIKDLISIAGEQNIIHNQKLFTEPMQGYLANHLPTLKDVLRYM